MKIKGLMLGMLACAALAGCSDDVIENGPEVSEVKEGTAYISLSIGTATNSSRSEGSTTGDGDGSIEDSGHEVIGTEEENAVNDVLVVAMLENAGTEDGIDGINRVIDNSAFTNNTLIGNQTVLTMTDLTDNALRVRRLGNYSVLVVVNPTEGLKTAVKNQTPAAAFTTVQNYQYTATAYANKTYTDYTINGFMMGCKEMKTVNVTDEFNAPDNAIEVAIEVERAIAKVMYRPYKADGISAENVWKITLDETVFNPIIQDGAWEEEQTDPNTETDHNWHYETVLNKAKGADGKEYWVAFDENYNWDDDAKLSADEVRNVFTKDTEGEKHSGWYDDDNNEQTPDVLKENVDVFYLVTNYDFTNNPLTLELGTASTPETAEKAMYMKLERYALTNLTNKIYGVRHTATSAFGSPKAFGTVTATNYLYTPWSTSLTGDDFSSAGTYFFQTLASVQTAVDGFVSGTTTDWSMFKELPTSATSENQEQTPSTAHNPSYTVGKLLGYAFENSTKVADAKAGWVTGIVFQGQMYTDANCTETVQVLYGYNNHYYRTLGDLLKAETDDALESLNASSTDEAAEAAGIDVYKDGKCYYYSAGIKHFEQPDADGVTDMEYAIMRNNIYSLGIEKFNSIGSSSVLPEPGESIEDKNAYITVKASILPWIVRFNAIEF